MHLAALQNKLAGDVLCTLAFSTYKAPVKSEALGQGPELSPTAVGFGP